VLEEAIRSLGPNGDFEHLLALTKREQELQEQKQAEIREASAMRTPPSVGVCVLQSDQEPSKAEI
jgi:hypothetical protein